MNQDKKAYETPALTELGSMEELTQGNGWGFLEMSFSDIVSQGPTDGGGLLGWSNPNSTYS